MKIPKRLVYREEEQNMYLLALNPSARHLVSL